MQSGRSPENFDLLSSKILDDKRNFRMFVKSSQKRRRGEFFTKRSQLQMTSPRESLNLGMPVIKNNNTAMASLKRKPGTGFRQSGARNNLPNLTQSIFKSNFLKKHEVAVTTAIPQF